MEDPTGNKVILSPSQQRVIDEFPLFLSSDEKEMVISGFPGSGKTFLVNYLLKIEEMQQKLIALIDPTLPLKKVYLTATTNKAAQILESFLDTYYSVSTIHNLLGLSVTNDYNTGKQKLVAKRNPGNLDNSLIFIDEASMIDVELLAHIRNKTQNYKNCKIIYIGDSYQLSPVREDVCSIFTKNKNFVFFLTEVQRQLKDNPIIKLSAEYRNVLDNPTDPWPEITTQGNSIIHYDSMDEFKEAIKACALKSTTPSEYKVLAWSNNQVQEYNKFIKECLGSTEAFSFGEIMITNKPIILGNSESIVCATDNLVCIEDIFPCTTQGIVGLDIKVRILCPRQDRPSICSGFQPLDWREANALAKLYAKDAKNTKNWRPYFTIQQNWLDLRPIYASTVHKAQGSTYREVFVDLNNIGQNNSWKEVARLAYVAITRASTTVHVYGNLTKKYNKVHSPESEYFKNVQCL